MKITVHRGTDQIGGCVTEYESNGWKLFVDYGEQLPGAPVSDKALEIEGLTYGNLRKSALLITHYHGDHIGKIAVIRKKPLFQREIKFGLSLRIKCLFHALLLVRHPRTFLRKTTNSFRNFGIGTGIP